MTIDGIVPGPEASGSGDATSLSRLETPEDVNSAIDSSIRDITRARSLEWQAGGSLAAIVIYRSAADNTRRLAQIRAQALDRQHPIEGASWMSVFEGMVDAAENFRFTDDSLPPTS